MTFPVQSTPLRVCLMVFLRFLSLWYGVLLTFDFDLDLVELVRFWRGR